MAETSISVVIPAYKAESYIRRAIDSVLAQTRPASEIIVVDDGSPDEQSRVVEEYGPPVVLLRQANRKTAIARNAGIERATGDFVAFLDADDYWEPEKLQRQLAVFEAHPELGVVASRFYYQQPNGTRQVNPFQLDRWYDRVWSLRGSNAFLLGTLLWTGTVMVRRAALEDDRFVSGLEPAEDRDLWIRLVSKYPTFLISEPLATAVLEPDGISRSSIALDCTKMLEVIEKKRGLLGIKAKRLWKSHTLYRWAANDPNPWSALPRLARSLWLWPLPYRSLPDMQRLGRFKRLLVLLAGSARSRSN